jgi:hypothetical protein
MGQKVPLCKKCNTTSSVPIKSKGKKSKKKAKGEWDSDVEDESDGPVYPPGIMKVVLFLSKSVCNDSTDNWPSAF